MPTRQHRCRRDRSQNQHSQHERSRNQSRPSSMQHQSSRRHSPPTPSQHSRSHRPQTPPCPDLPPLRLQNLGLPSQPAHRWLLTYLDQSVDSQQRSRHQDHPARGLSSPQTMTSPSCLQRRPQHRPPKCRRQLLSVLLSQACATTGRHPRKHPRLPPQTCARFAQQKPPHLPPQILQQSAHLPTPLRTRLPRPSCQRSA